MRPSLRVAIIGTGMIAAAHARAARDAGATVLGVLGSSPSSSAAAAATWGIPSGFQDLDELLLSRPDVVHVCSPNSTHLSYGRAIAEAGIHLVVEKPIATTLHDAQLLEEAVREAGVVATVPFAYRFHPLVREMRERRRRGDIGDVILLHGSYLQDWLLSPDVSNWRADASVGGSSRAFADIGSHWCDLAEFISGERFASLQATFSIVHPTRSAASSESFSSSGAAAARVSVDTEDIALLTLRSDRGVHASVTISQVSAGRKNRLWIEVDGTRQSLVFDQEQPESLWIGTPDGARIIRRGEGTPSADQHRLLRTPPGHPQGWPDAFAAFCADTYAAVRGEDPEGLPTLEDGVRSMRLIDAALESVRSREWKDVIR
ncbi:oxidoreductase [Microbacterium sp. MYb64]|nr:oxidoreductase [Microbacterium sp. MYb64]